MEVVIAWLTIASLILFVIGLIDPAIALPWSRERTRKRAAMVYGYAFFAMVALGIVFFPRTNLESRLYALFFLLIAALAAGLAYPPVVLPWVRDASRKAVLFFYLPPVVLLICAMVYANASRQVDPRYYIPPGELAGADQVKTLKYRAASELRGQNNIGLDRVRKIEVSEAKGGGYDVLVEFNIDFIIPSLFSLVAQSDMMRVYKAVYTTGYDVKNVTVTAYSPGGYREMEGETPPAPVPVMTTSLDADTAAGVDWSLSPYELQSSVLPKVWKVGYKREGFK